MTNFPNTYAERQLGKIADALESIAKSQEKLANPPTTLWATEPEFHIEYSGEEFDMDEWKTKLHSGGKHGGKLVTVGDALGEDDASRPPS